MAFSHPARRRRQGRLGRRPPLAGRTAKADIMRARGLVLHFGHLGFWSVHRNGKEIEDGVAIVEKNS